MSCTGTTPHPGWRGGNHSVKPPENAELARPPLTPAETDAGARVKSAIDGVFHGARIPLAVAANLVERIREYCETRENPRPI